MFKPQTRDGGNRRRDSVPTQNSDFADGPLPPPGGQSYQSEVALRQSSLPLGLVIKGAMLYRLVTVYSASMRQRVAARMVASSSSNVDEDTLSNISINLTDSELSYCDRFQVGPDELPLENWKSGRRCTLLDKEHPLTGSKNGRLYLSQNNICFERSTQLSEKSDRFSILLKDIASINKAKPFAVMPGSGMSIEIHLKSGGKPLLFGAILHRDQVFREVCHQGMVLGLPWGSDPDATGLEPSSSEPHHPPAGSTASSPDLTSSMPLLSD